MRPILGPALERLAILGVRYPKALLLIGALVTAAAVYAALGLSVDPAIQSLLPKNRPVVEEYVATEIEFMHTEYLLVVVEIPPDAPFVRYRSFLLDYKKRLNELPEVHHEQIDLTRDLVEKVQKYFLAHGLLLGDDSVLEMVDRQLNPESVEQSLREESPYRKYLWRNLFDPLQLYGVAQKVFPLAQKTIIDQTGEFFITKDPSLLFFFLSVRDPWEWDQTKKLVDRARVIEEEAWQKQLPGLEALNPGRKIERPKITWVGKHMNVLKSAYVLWENAQITSLLSAIGIGLAFLIFYRNFKSLILAYIPILVGSIWSYALASVTVHELNSLTIMMGSVLLGAGIDFPVYLLNEYYQRREQGKTLTEALSQTWRTTGRAVSLGAVSTCAAFGILLFSKLPAYQEIGFLVGIGLIVTLIAVLAFLPPLVALLETRKRTRQIPKYPDFLIRLPISKTGRTILVSGLILLVSLPFVYHFRFDSPYHESYVLLRESAEVNTAADRRLGLLLDSSMQPFRLIVEGADWEETLQKNDRLASLLETYHQRGRIAFFDTLHNWLPSQELQERRYATVNKLPHLRAEVFLKDYRERIKRFPSRDRRAYEKYGKKIGEFLSVAEPATPETFTDSGLQSILQFYATNGEGNIRLSSYVFLPNVYYPTAKESLMNDLVKEEMFQAGDVFYPSEERDIGEIKQIVTRELFWLSPIVLVVIIVIFTIHFRSAKLALICVLPTVLGGVAAMACYLLLKGPFSIFNIPFIPVYLGLATDDVLHLGSSFDGGRASVERALRRTGMMIVLTSVTTIIGFGSLIFAKTQLLKQIGTWICVSLSVELVASLLLLPALLSLAVKRQKA